MIKSLVGYYKTSFFSWQFCPLLILIIFGVKITCFSQKNDIEVIQKNIVVLTNGNLTVSQKLSGFYDLKRKFEKTKLTQDSVYAKILHKIGSYEMFCNNDYEKAIMYTFIALRINMSAEKNASRIYAIADYFNLGSYYKSLMIFDKSLVYYDSTIKLAQNFGSPGDILDSRLQRADIFFSIGDYEKCIDESNIGIQYSLQKNDSASYISFLNERAQSLFFQGDLKQCLNDLEIIVNSAKNIPAFELAMALKTKGLVYEKMHELINAEALFEQAIQTRKKTHDPGQIASDFNDLGNFYLNSLHNYSKAKICYFKTIEYAHKTHDSSRLSLAYINLAEESLTMHKFNESEQYYFMALECLKINMRPNILLNPAASSFKFVGNKDLVFVMMSNKTKLLLNLFHDTKRKDYLEACLKTALTTDTLITSIRHDQTGEQSKLYWRKLTREFFTTAIEAAYLADKPDAAFDFMEKSRSVLLNDKLNELGASAQLPVSESGKEQGLRIHMVQEEQKLESFKSQTDGYKNQQQKLLEAKDEFEHYIKSLEQKYPVYYQYKYDDKVPSLVDLQKYLASSQQAFLHYFIGDTIAYVLGITSSETKLIKLSKSNFDQKQLTRFQQLCSDRNSLNNNYSSFASLSNSVYKFLFYPFQIPNRRIIICPDIFLIPFEALCTDTTGNNFLINKYAFSYVYSARYLLKKFDASPSKGNFVGFAPVTFQSYLRLPELRESAMWLRKSAKHYMNTQLFINTAANRGNFLNSINLYKIVNIFSHASADTAVSEPVLFMQDSIIRLSELQILRNRAANLIVLSGCETEVGKGAPGEGIYSLARGFSAAGIPSVAATLWHADEQATYRISENFNRYLSQGMLKDEALREAKLDFLHTSNRENLLPYYWANMILVGNTNSITFSTNIAKSSNMAWWIAGWIVLISALLITFKNLIVSKKD